MFTLDFLFKTIVMGIKLNVYRVNHRNTIFRSKMRFLSAIIEGWMRFEPSLPLKYI